MMVMMMVVMVMMGVMVAARSEAVLLEQSRGHERSANGRRRIMIAMSMVQSFIGTRATRRHGFLSLNDLAPINRRPPKASPRWRDLENTPHGIDRLAR
jgi:hypothetical protein